MSKFAQTIHRHPPINSILWIRIRSVAPLLRVCSESVPESFHSNIHFSIYNIESSSPGSAGGVGPPLQWMMWSSPLYCRGSKRLKFLAFVGRSTWGKGGGGSRGMEEELGFPSSRRTRSFYHHVLVREEGWGDKRKETLCRLRLINAINKWRRKK